MGKPIIDQLYRSLLSSDLFFGFVCYHNNDLVGFATGTFDHEKTRDFVAGIYKKKLLKIIINSLLHPDDLIILFESRFVIPKILKNYNTHAEWLNLITDIKDNKELYAEAAFQLRERIRLRFAENNVETFIGQVYANKEKIRKYHAKYGNSKIIKRLLANDIYIFYSGNKINE